MVKLFHVKIELIDGTVIRVQGEDLVEIIDKIKAQVADDHAVVTSLKINTSYHAPRVAEA